MRVAIVGASNDRNKFGNKAVRSYVTQGHEVVPVHPAEAEVEGLKAYPSVGEVPGHLDRVLLYVPAKVGLGVLDDVASKGIDGGEVWVNPGADSEELFQKAEHLGLSWVFSCAIVDIGDSPVRY